MATAPFSDEEVYWLVAVLILGFGFVFIQIPTLYLFWRWRKEHHIMTWAFLHLLIPDVIMVLDFLPAHIVDLANGELINDAHCTVSSFVIVACILASNGGAICIAYVTNYSLDVRNTSKPITKRFLFAWMAVDWILGLALASYFLGLGFIGPHLGIYCCATDVQDLRVSMPVFAVYTIALASMVYLYRSVYTNTKTTVLPTATRAPLIRGASGPANSINLHSTHPSDGGPMSPTSAPPTSRKKSTPDVGSAVLKRGLLMVSVYYLCWSLIVLNAIFELSGWQSRSLYWDIVAAWLSKCQPSIDGIIVFLTMYNAHTKRQRAAIRAHDGSKEREFQAQVGVGAARTILVSQNQPSN